MNDQERVSTTQMLAEYYKAFSTLDVSAIAPYYLEPCFVAGPLGAGALPTRRELAAFLTPALEDFRARGYGRSELAQLRLHRLSDGDVLATGVAVRIKKDGQELDRAGVTYLLRKIDQAWKIAVLVVHDPANDLQA